MYRQYGISNFEREEKISVIDVDRADNGIHRYLRIPDILDIVSRNSYRIILRWKVDEERTDKPFDKDW